MTLKYVMFDDGLPVLFGDYLKHGDLRVMNRQPTSAGRVRVTDGKVTVIGKSTSYPNLPPVDGDAEIIQRVLEFDL